MMEFALCNLIWREKKGGGFGFEAQTHFSNQVKKRERCKAGINAFFLLHRFKASHVSNYP